MRSLSTVLLVCLIGFLSVNGLSQELASKTADHKIFNQPRSKFVSLDEALSQLEKAYDVHIVYDDAVVSGKTSPYLVSASKSFQEALEAVIGEAPIEYKKIGARTIVLQPAEPPKPSPPLQTYATIQGRVTDEFGQPLAGAQVFLEGTTLGDVAQANGEYEIKNVPPGPYKLIIKFIGYRTGSADISVGVDQTITQDFSLIVDVLSMEEVVTTGVANERSKIESSVAITTVSAKGISDYAPRGAADLMKVIPGFYIESSGGEGNGNGFARGIPQPGGFRYMQFQEDGLPVFEYGDLMFGNTDILFRVDASVDRLESVRGGSASILTSNAPGGIVNLISRTGGPSFSGQIKQTVGLDYRHSRTDISFGGPLGNRFRYHVGGFYRADDGIRNTGFTANQGGQVKGNLTYLLDNGHLRLNFKYLDDKTAAYLPIPLQGETGSDEIGNDEIPGFDANFGTLQSVDFMRLNATTPNGTEVNEDLDVGMSPNVRSIGGELLFDLGDGWTLRDDFNRSVIEGEFNGIFPFSGGPFNFNDLASDVFGLDASAPLEVSFARGFRAGQPLTANELENITGNQLIGRHGWWAVDIPLNHFINNLQVTKTFETEGAGTHNLTAGYYFNTNEVSAVWWWHDMLVTISDESRAVNVVDAQTGNPLTSNGFIQYGTLYRDYRANTRINALYFNDEIRLSNLTIDGGVRFDIGEIDGFTENTETFDYDVDGDGVITPAEQGVQYGNNVNIPFSFDYDDASWSVGANYKVNNSLAIFGRASNGHRAPADRTYAFGATIETEDGFPPGTKLENVFQYELGAKWSSSNIGFFGTVFGSVLDDVPFTDFVTDPETGVPTAVQEFYNTLALGIEAEVVGRFRDFSFVFNGTFQDLEYQDWVFRDADGNVTDFDGNQIARVPKVYFTFRPSYKIDIVNLNGTVLFFGDRYTDPGNTQKLPSYGQLNLGASVNVSNNVTLGINAVNVTNSTGLTEGNPRQGLVRGVTGQFFYARPILGRSIVTSASYTF